MAEGGQDPWESAVYRRNYECLLSLDAVLFRSKAFEAGLITGGEKEDLASLGGGRKIHNEELLKWGKGPGGPASFLLLVKTVRLLGPKYDEQRKDLESVLPVVASSGGVSGATAANSGAQAASPAAAAAATAKKPPADRSKNPWQTTEYKSKYTNLLVLMEDSDILAKCFSLGMISESMRLAISEVTDSRHRKEKLLSSISTTTKNFVKFREILRTDSIERYADYMDDLDSVGPDPEDPEYQDIRAQLQK